MTALLEDIDCSSKPVFIYFHTTNPGNNPAKPSKTFNSCKSTEDAVTGQFNDLNIGIAISYQFNCYKVEVPVEPRFKKLSYKSTIPLFCIVDADKKIVGKAGGKGKAVNPRKLFATMCKACKSAWGIDLKKRVQSFVKILNERIKEDGTLQSLTTVCEAMKSDKKKKPYKKKIKKCRDKLNDLKEQQESIFSTEAKTKLKLLVFLQKAAFMPLFFLQQLDR